jgi:hypothetical protein
MNATSMIALFLVLALAGCTGNRDSIARIDLATLLIGPKEMPPGWSTEGPKNIALEPDRSSDSAGIAFYSDLYPEALGSGQDIYRFKSIRDARRDFAYATTLYATKDIPQAWHFRSTFADASNFSCRTYSNVSFPVCTWIARYDRIVIQFSAWLVPERMTLQDLENLVRQIDLQTGQVIMK